MRRSSFEIIACILQECLIPKRKTHIMYKANVSFPQLNNYLNQLSSRNLLVAKNNGYVTTAKGLQFLSIFGQLESMMSLPSEPVEETNGFQLFTKSLIPQGSKLVIENRPRSHAQKHESP